MFFISAAIVIGPTPPGTGVIQPARSGRFVELHVADELAVRQPIDADVDHDRARPDPGARHELGLPDRGDEDLRLADLPLEVARSGCGRR